MSPHFPPKNKTMRKRKKVDYHAPLITAHTFHVYNRTNNKEILFKDDEDRKTFLEKYREYVAEYVDTYAFCLLGNHFHFVLRVKSVEHIAKIVSSIDKSNRGIAQQKFLKQVEKDRTVFEVMERQFNKFFTSYAKYFNKKYKRQGNLFTRRFKRIAIQNEVHFGRLICYVHTNPRKHKFMSAYQNYYWSSYKAYLGNQPTLLARNIVLDWFGGINGFIEHHLMTHNYDDMLDILIED